MKEVFRGKILDEITSILSDGAMEQEPVAFFSVTVMKRADGEFVPTVTAMYDNLIVRQMAFSVMEKVVRGVNIHPSNLYAEQPHWVDGVPKNDEDRQAKVVMILNRIEVEIGIQCMSSYVYTVTAFHLFDSPGCFIFRWVHGGVERKRTICVSLDKSVDDAVEWVMSRLLDIL